LEEKFAKHIRFIDDDVPTILGTVCRKRYGCVLLVRRSQAE